MLTPRRSARPRSPGLPVFVLLALSSALAQGAKPAPVAPLADTHDGAPAGDGAAGITPLVGTWTLSAADDLRPDGTRAPAYGEHPQGILMVDASGQYSLQIYRTDRANFASGDKRRATPQEYEAAVLGMSAHVGHCSLDAKSGIVTFAIALAAYPNWQGTVQKRQYTLTGDTLSYQIPAAASSGGNIPISVWKQVR